MVKLLAIKEKADIKRRCRKINWTPYIDLKCLAEEDEAVAHRSLDMHAVVLREFPKS
jgi:hypothetical protein